MCLRSHPCLHSFFHSRAHRYLVSKWAWRGRAGLHSEVCKHPFPEYILKREKDGQPGIEDKTRATNNTNLRNGPASQYRRSWNHSNHSIFLEKQHLAKYPSIQFVSDVLVNSCKPKKLFLPEKQGPNDTSWRSLSFLVLSPGRFLLTERTHHDIISTICH